MITVAIIIVLILLVAIGCFVLGAIGGVAVEQERSGQVRAQEAERRIDRVVQQTFSDIINEQRRQS